MDEQFEGDPATVSCGVGESAARSSTAPAPSPRVEHDAQVLAVMVDVGTPSRRAEPPGPLDGVDLQERITPASPESWGVPSGAWLSLVHG